MDNETRIVRAEPGSKVRASKVLITGPDGGCAYCGRNTTELEEHHLSPKVLFKEEADEWPTIMLCKRCHRRWHTRVNLAVVEAVAKQEKAYAAFRVMVDPDDMLDPLERIIGESSEDVSDLCDEARIESAGASQGDGRRAGANREESQPGARPAQGED